MIIIALGLLVLAGVGAFALDVSYLYGLKHRLQAAADAAALAGASQLPDASNARTTAIEFAAKNMPSTQHGTVLSTGDVDVGNWDPTTAIFAVGGTPYNAIRVTTRRDHTNNNAAGLFLARTIGFDSADLAASSIAGRTGEPICLLALDPSAQGAISVDSNSTITLNGCGIQVNSNHGNAFMVAANSSIAADSICIAGGYGGLTSAYTPTPTTGCAVMADPLADRPGPTVGPCDYTNTVLTNNNSFHLSPGVYCGGITSESNVTITMDPGIYIIKDGQLKFGSNVSVTGVGVGFYLTGSDATIKFTSNTIVDLSAPTSGVMEGLVFFEDRTNPMGQIHEIDSNTNQQYEGTLYLPRGTVKIDSNGSVAGSVAYTAIIANRYTFSSNANLYLNGDFEASPVPAACEISGSCLRLVN